MPSSLWTALNHRKPLAEIKKNLLHPTLTMWDLTSLGVACVVGAGIFVITGVAAAKYAGPGLCISFMISAVSCFFTGLSFAELSTALPVVGSSYIYSYVFIGEGIAWLVGVCLAMENLFAAAAVAVGFSSAFSQLLYDAFGVAIPPAVAFSTFIVDDDNEIMWNHHPAFNLVAVMLIIGLSLVLSFGISESASVTTAAVFVKVGVLLALIFYGIYHMFSQPEEFHANHTPFVPPADETKFGKYGFWGLLRGASASFFAYIGFDSVCAMSAEAKNPAVDIPRALAWTLVICTTLYILVTYFLTGLVNYKELNVASPVTFALQKVDAPFAYLVLTDIGAVAGLLSVASVCLLGQSRIVYAMAIDELLPSALAHVDERFKVPRGAILYCGVLCCIMCGLLPIDVIGDLVSFGTLCAFVVVHICVIQKRKLFPDMESPFLVPSMILPYLGLITSLSQIFFLPLATLRNFFVVIAVSYVFYFVFRLQHVVEEVEKRWRKDEVEHRGRHDKPMDVIVDEVWHHQGENDEKEKDDDENKDNNREKNEE